MPTDRRPRRDSTADAARKSIEAFDKLGLSPPQTTPRRDADEGGATAATLAEGRSFGIGSTGSSAQQLDADGVQGEGRERDYRTRPPAPGDGPAPFRVTR